MAGKSLLQQFGWSCGKYKVNEVENLCPGQPGMMEGSYRKAEGSDNGPPPKKRKTEEEMGRDTDTLWDDDMEITEDELHSIELLASQAMTQSKQETKVAPSTSTSSQRVLQPIHPQTVGSSQGRFVKPQLSRSSSSSASSKNPSLQSNNSVSSQSKTSGQSSKSSYPESLSGYSKTSSSSSLRSGSSNENVQVVGSQAAVAELATTKQELAKLKLQLENLQQEVYVKDGENQVLRDNLTSKETELDSLKMEKISHIHQQNVQQNEREKSLQNEVSKLQTQLQFKTQEERELTSRCKELQIQLKNVQQPVASTSQGFLSTQSVSPKPTRVLVEERSPKGQSKFPSRQTFMAEEVSPAKRSQPAPSGDNWETISSVPDKPNMKLLGSRHKHGLKLQKRSSTHSGSQLVAKLLDIPPSKTGTISDKGILGLLSSPSANTSSYKMQFERDKNTSLLSPVRGRRLSDLHSLLTRTEPNFVSLVPTDHFNMAVQGLSNLIREENVPPEFSSSTDTVLTASGSLDVQKLHDAILVLPVINDYLKHYLDMFETTLETSDGSSSTTTVTSSSSGSYDASSESLTGSFGSFIKSSANSANDLECLAIASVETLHVLLSSPAVKDILLYSETKSSPQTPSTSADFEVSDSDLDIQYKDAPTKLSFIRKYVIKLEILKKILKLSNPGNKTGLRNPRMVIDCLDVHEVLAVHADERQIVSLLPVLSDESIQNCMDRETDADVVIHSLMLLKTLLKSNQVVSSLCSNATGCVLMTVYNLCLKKFTNESVDTRLTISSSIVECILYLASSHRGCFTLVLESDCLCSSEVVKSVVILLHSVMKIYKMCVSKRQRMSNDSMERLNQDTSLIHHQETSQAILQNGLHLLHLMSQIDTEFANRHIPVQHRYVQLICGITHMLRNMENNDSELNAVQDLWDFNQDDSELSQDSDSDEPMDQQ